MTASSQSTDIEKPIQRLETRVAEITGIRYAVAMSGRTQAVHIALRLAAERQYGGATTTRLLAGKKVFCPDFTTIETVQPVLYEGGEPVFIDALEDDWCMDPEVLELAFEKYPEVRIVIAAGVYGFAGQMQRIREICHANGALLIEDATESIRATAPHSNYTIVGFEEDWNKGGGGAALLTDDAAEMEKARQLIGETGEDTHWQQHEMIRYDFRIPEILAALAQENLKHIESHQKRKREIYKRYQRMLDPDVITMNEPEAGEQTNYGASAILLESAIPFKEIRTQREYTYHSIHGTASPMELIEALEAFGAEALPVWKPMHMQPLFIDCDQISLDGSIRDYPKEEAELMPRHNASKYLFEHGVCLLSSEDLTEEEQDRIIQIVHACFVGADMKTARRA